MALSPLVVVPTLLIEVISNAGVPYNISYAGVNFAVVTIYGGQPIDKVYTSNVYAQERSRRRTA